MVLAACWCSRCSRSHLSARCRAGQDAVEPPSCSSVLEQVAQWHWRQKVSLQLLSPNLSLQRVRQPTSECPHPILDAPATPSTCLSSLERNTQDSSRAHDACSLVCVCFATLQAALRLFTNVLQVALRLFTFVLNSDEARGAAPAATSQSTRTHYVFPKALQNARPRLLVHASWPLPCGPGWPPACLVLPKQSIYVQKRSATNNPEGRPSTPPSRHVSMTLSATRSF